MRIKYNSACEVVILAPVWPWHVGTTTVEWWGRTGVSLCSNLDPRPASGVFGNLHSFQTLASSSINKAVTQSTVKIE